MRKCWQPTAELSLITGNNIVLCSFSGCQPAVRRHESTRMSFATLSAAAAHTKLKASVIVHMKQFRQIKVTEFNKRSFSTLLAILSVQVAVQKVTDDVPQEPTSPTSKVRCLYAYLEVLRQHGLMNINQ
jgi:hypothetical protein